MKTLYLIKLRFNWLSRHFRNRYTLSLFLFTNTIGYVLEGITFVGLCCYNLKVNVEGILAGKCLKELTKNQKITYKKAS